MSVLSGTIDTLDLRLPSPVEEVCDERLARRGVRPLLKRDDLIHPEIPGNKWRKLQYNLAAALDLGYETLLTFGGAYSNHIRATAAAGRLLGLATVGVVRGEAHTPLNPSLAFAASRGMHLTYLDRATYRAKHTREVTAALRREFGDVCPAAPRSLRSSPGDLQHAWFRPGELPPDGSPNQVERIRDALADGPVSALRTRPGYSAGRPQEWLPASQTG